VEVGAVAGDTVELIVGKGAGKARATLRRKEIQLAFSQVLRDLTGVYLKPVVKEARRASPAEPVDEDLRAHPAVQLVTDRTGGRLLNLERAPDPAEQPPARKGTADDGARA
jgi:hypothetical protein